MERVKGFSSKTMRVLTKNCVSHTYLKEVFGSSSIDSLIDSISRTGNKSVYPIVGTILQGQEEVCELLSGATRLEAMMLLGVEEVEVIVLDIKDESEKRKVIIDLNKQRIKSGRVKLMEFRFYLEMYPEQRGIPGNRYIKIGKEIGENKNKVKELMMLNNFFQGEGDCILEKVFAGEMSNNQADLLKKAVEKYLEKFTAEESFRKLCDGSYDFYRLDYALANLDLNDELEFDIIKKYLKKELSTDQFRDMLEKMGKVEQRKENHRKNKVAIPEIDVNYVSEHVHLIKGNNREVEFVIPFGKLIRCLVGSCPYGDLRLNSDNPDTETGHNMSGHEYGV